MAIEVGNVLEGRVTGVKPFGAFVALPEGKSGMVHISEVSNEYVQDINTVLHDGDAVKVQVINIAPDGKIALSIKRLLPPAPRAPALNARAYGPTGQFAGSVSRDGRTYDSTGHYVGRADSSGRIYGPTGKYVGRSDSYARQQNAPKPVSGSLNR